MGDSPIRDLFPRGVAASQLHEFPPVDTLLPAEAACLGAAVPQRAAEFAAGRLCARRALAELGIADFALIAAPDRRPLWPDSIVGSITHTEGFCAAVVGRKRDFIGLGLDTEIIGRVGAHLWPRICTAEELAWITALPVPRRSPAAALVFAAKEAFYKCQYPLTAEWLGFQDLRIQPGDLKLAVAEGGADTFSVVAARRLALEDHVALPVTGRYRLHAQFVSAAVALPANA